MNNFAMSAQNFMQKVMNNHNLMQSNPVLQNMSNMIQTGDTKGLEKMARNLCKEKGVDPDKMYKDIYSKMGMQ
jgi:hypothetical protein